MSNKSQWSEYDDLEEHLIAVTWILHKKNIQRKCFNERIFRFKKPKKGSAS